MTDEHDSRRQDFIKGLRELADYLEARPELPTPWPTTGISAWVTGDSKRSAREQLAACARAMGHAEKDHGDEYFRLYAPEFSGGLRYYVVTEREQVCERVVLGTETVEEIDPDWLINAPKVTVERELVEWRCADSLLKAGEPA